METYESGEEETMETLVAADSFLNMDCADTLSLEEHYCKLTSFPPVAAGYVRLWNDIFRHGGHSAACFH